MKNSLLLVCLSFLLASCGSKKNDSNLLAVNPGRDVNLENLQIKKKYGITDDTDLVSLLHTIEGDLNDSGVYFAESYKSSIKPVYVGKRKSQKNIDRKVARAWKKGEGSKVRHIEWRDTVDKCEDLIVSLDYDFQTTEQNSSLQKLFIEYRDVAQLILTRPDLHDLSCIGEKKVRLSQIEINRISLTPATAGQSPIEGRGGRVPYAK